MEQQQQALQFFQNLQEPEAFKLQVYKPEDIAPLHSFFKIQTKSKPYSAWFKPNRAQLHYYHHKTARDLILKARQLGFTTFIKMSDLDEFIRFPDIRCTTIADTREHANEIFHKMRYAFDNLPDVFKNKFQLNTDTRNEIRSESTGSVIHVATSGRSGTSQRLHVSEFAHMRPHQKQEVIAGSLAAVPDDGYAVIETTAKGQEEFYDLWKEAVAGKNEWTPHFYNWTWDDNYQRLPPPTDMWKSEYISLAKQYNLIADIQKRLNITDAQFYWYYLRVKQYKELVKQEYPSIPEEAFLGTSHSVFNMYTLQQMEGTQPIEMMYGGNLLIWEEPIDGEDYVIGVDTSEGDINSDFGVGVVLNAKTGVQVAELHGRYRSDAFASVLNNLGLWYNKAMISVERNNHGHAVLVSLENVELYPNIYIHEDEKPGFPTNAKTKPMMLTSAEGLAFALDEELIKIKSQGFIDEARVFEYKQNKVGHFGMGAQEGKHDDRVMATAIAWITRPYALVPRGRDGKPLYLG